MTNREALSGRDESSGECDWVPRRSKSQAEGCAAANCARWRIQALVKQQSRRALALEPVDARGYLDDARACLDGMGHSGRCVLGGCFGGGGRVTLDSGNEQTVSGGEAYW
jgi:hypothetical protein